MYTLLISVSHLTGSVSDSVQVMNLIMNDMSPILLFC